MNRKTRRSAIPIAMTAIAALSLGACAQDAETDTDAPITLTLSTFGNFGYTEEFLAGFTELYPNITVEHSIAASGSDVRTSLITGLAANAGLADVEAIEISWMAEMAEYSDQFVPVPGDNPGGPWVDAQQVPATASDGSLWAYGVGIGPTAICYRADMFDAAGLPTDPVEVAELLDGDWDNYFALGDEYVTNGGPGAWFDSAFGIFQARMLQLPYGFEDENDAIIVDTDPAIENLYRDTLEYADTQSAALATWSNDWYAGMQNSAFATMSCPSWMLAIIEGSAPEASDWRIADAFPAGGGNWGGSFLAVPVQSSHPDEAALLAQWLTAPEQQVELFASTQTFPSRTAAFEIPTLLDSVNAYFGDAPIGEIFTNRAEAIESFAYQGPKGSLIGGAITSALTRVENEGQSVDAAWSQFIDEVDELRGE